MYITRMVIRYSLCFDVGWLRAKHVIVCCRLLILMQTTYQIQYDTLLTHERHPLQATFFHLSTPNKCENGKSCYRRDIHKKRAESPGKMNKKSHTSRSLYMSLSLNKRILSFLFRIRFSRHWNEKIVERALKIHT